MKTITLMELIISEYNTGGFMGVAAGMILFKNKGGCKI